MSLRGWSWDAAIGPAGLGDRPLLEALAAAIPDEAVEATIEATGTRERRRRLLPTHLVVTLVVAMGLWASESMRHVLAEVVAGWREGSEAEPAGWHLPSTAAIVQARQRAGARLLRELFQSVARPIATAQTPRAFLGGLRLMAIDGSTIDVADTSENDRAFGRPTTKRGDGAFPQIRVLALIETGTHVICDAVIRPFSTGEVPTALRLLRSVGPGMLLLWDRGFHSYEMVRTTLGHKAHFLGRTKQGFSTNKFMVGYYGWFNERSAANDAFLPILADGEVDLLDPGEAADGAGVQLFGSGSPKQIPII
jgi:hypothetical protein